MPRKSFNVDVRIGGRKNCRVRKRGCSSSSSLSLMANYGLKRALLMEKRVGITTQVPLWKRANGFPKSAIWEKDESFKYARDLDNKAKELSSASARKLAATLWEIDGISLRENSEEKIKSGEERVLLESSKSGSMALASSDLFSSSVSKVMDQPKPGGHRRRASAGSQKLLQADCDSGGSKSLHNCLVEMQNHEGSPCRHIIESNNHLKGVYNSLVTSKELLKVMAHVCCFDEHDSTSSSLFTALKFELGRARNHVGKLIQEQRSDSDKIDILIKRFEEENVVWKMKQRERICSTITAIAGELRTEKKLRLQTERLNKKLGRELAETKVCLIKTAKELENERRTQKILEQACDELARGIGEDRAEVEELKRQSAKVREEVEKEREMLQLADVLREERVQMKLTEAKYQFEEKNALVEKLRNELETYLKSKMGEEEEQLGGSPGFDKIKELKKYLRETLPGSCPYEDEEKDGTEVLNKDHVEKEEEDDDSDDSGSDLHSIELNMDDVRKSFGWNEDVRIASKRNSVDKIKGRKSISKKIKKPNVASAQAKFVNGNGWEFSKKETLDEFDKRGMFDFVSQSWKKDSEDEMERYNMIKDLRDHIVSSARMGSSQESVSPSKNLGQTCQG